MRLDRSPSPGEDLAQRIGRSPRSQGQKDKKIKSQKTKRQKNKKNRKSLTIIMLFRLLGLLRLRWVVSDIENLFCICLYRLTNTKSHRMNLVCIVIGIKSQIPKPYLEQNTKNMEGANRHREPSQLCKQ